MNIGILLPRSDIHPGIGLEFMDGLKTSLNGITPAIPVQFYAEGVGFGGMEKDVYQKAEKLLMIDGVDILLAFIDERILDLILPLANASGKLIVVINAGANCPQNWVPQPNVVRLTLQHVFLCWLSGKLTAAEENKKAALTTTFYDCGYLHTAKMVTAFMQSGGELTFNYISKRLYREGLDISELNTFLLANTDTTNLCSIFDAWPASLFYALLNETEYADRLHLFCSPMMFEPRALENIGAGFKFKIDGYLPWHITLDNEANKNLNTIYKQKTKKDPSIFSLLGWEAGLIVRTVVTKSPDDYADGAALVKQLGEEKLDSPRGKMVLDATTQFFISAPVRAAIPAGTNSLTLSTKDNYQNEWNEFTEEPLSGTSSGWTNTYLCY
jgi:branched-chain amino acid transport system substrate-binding protein